MNVHPMLFLEDVATGVKTFGDKKVYEVRNLGQHPLFRGHDLPPVIYVVDFPDNGAGRRLLLDRPCCGPDVYELIADTTHEMARLFLPMMEGNIAQFIIAHGGRPQDMCTARPRVFADYLPDTTIIKLQRVPDSGAPLGFHVEMRSMVGKWWDVPTWIHLDECIASGVTGSFFFENAFEEMAGSQFGPERIITFPVIASWNGLEVMYRVCRENDVEFIPVLNSAIVEVQANGVELPNTDLGLQPRTVMTHAFCEQVVERYQGKPICWVGDFGHRLFNRPKHVVETLRDMLHHGWDFAREDFSSWNPILFRPEFLEVFARKEPAVFAEVEKFIRR